MLKAPIVPTKYLDCLKEEPYLMCLAQEALKDPTYKQFYKKQSKKGAYVILDNGAYEGQQVSVIELVRLSKDIGASEMILIDKVRNATATRIETFSSLQFIRKKYSAMDSTINLMAVPHGSELRQWFRCAEDLAELDIQCIGISKILLSQFEDNIRDFVISELSSYDTNKKVHLLGAGDDPWEAARIAHEHPDLIRGTDSSIPYVYAAADKLITDGSRPDIVIDFQQPVECDIDLLEQNISLWKKGKVLDIE